MFLQVLPAEKFKKFQIMANGTHIYRLILLGHFKLPFYRSLLLTIVLYLFGIGILHAQNDIIVQDIILGKAEVSAPNSITLKPGFQAKEGSNFHAFIGANQGQNSSLTVTSPSSGVTPAAGSTGMNYVKSIIYREAKTTIPSGSYKHIEEIQYYDGLGRPVQSIQGHHPLGMILYSRCFMIILAGKQKRLCIILHRKPEITAQV